MVYRLLIAGSRDWEPSGLIKRDLLGLMKDLNLKPKNLLVIHGGAKGVDTTAGKVANSLGVHTACVDALWSSYGRSAGPTRNAMMLTLEPNEAFAYSKDIDASKGTLNMVTLLNSRSIPVKIISS